MHIEKQIKNYLIFSGQTILEALNRVNENQSRIVFVVQENGILIGALSDGDVRRWITKSGSINLNEKIDAVMNRDFIKCKVFDAPVEISKHFNAGIDLIPLIDGVGRFVAIARESVTGFQIGKFRINDQSPSFIIAEVGNNHQGDLARAKMLVDLAVSANADCVKFQMRDLSSLYSNNGKVAEISYDLGSQYTLDLLNKYQLPHDKLFEVFDYCYSKGVLPLCTPWDLASVKLLDEYGLEGFKVASADFTNFKMLEALGKTGKPLICSTGMSRENEINMAVDFLDKLGVSYALLHCNSTYPTPFKDVNLKYLPRLKQICKSVVGYSGHERGSVVPIAAVAMGAKIIEKHFTDDKSLEGNDHKVSLLPHEFADMVSQIRSLEMALGSDGEREISQGELINRENLAKSLIINCDLKIGDIIERGMIDVKSPGQGLQPNRIEEVIGKKVYREFLAGDFIYESDLFPVAQKKDSYSFGRPYGIPVRFHDFISLTTETKVDFVEFHLSYHDLSVDIDKYFFKTFPIEYAVHAPELFSGDHILDLASEDADYQAHSIMELGRTVEISKELRKYFPKTKEPILVVNAGGWNPKGFVPAEKKQALYDKVVKSINQVNLNGVRLAIQTMPPFPWHFGGQSFHNLFVDPNEIVKFCQSTDLKICLDVSHSMMACNYYHWNFSEFLKKVLPYTIHLHISDAKGVDGEGIQMGFGDVDFIELKQLLDEYAPKVPFIPEVWQGHKNSGEGFWGGLSFLENVGI